MEDQEKLEKGEETGSKGTESKGTDKYVIGSMIFIGCLIFLAAIYVIDTGLGVFGLEHVGVTKEVLETVKTLLFTICGYLFGKNVNHSCKKNS